MVMLVIILSLLILGLVLLIVEVIFIPGTTVVGILGIVFSTVGVIVSYKHYGDEVGFYVLLSTLLATAITLFYSFKTGAWNRFSLKSSIKGKVNEGITDTLKIGDEGVTTSSLRPSGKAEFHDQIFEVRSLGQYIPPNVKIRIIQMELHQIIVEEINNHTTK
jgi:membrane-bound ClpP family serine protease